jgi:hypothetical protein
MNQISGSVREKTQCPKEDENDGDEIQEVVHIDWKRLNLIGLKEEIPTLKSRQAARR